MHFAPTAADARDIVLGLCHDYGAKLVAKGKSMVSEEIALNAHLQAAGIEVVETDLGEYIVQLKGEAPSTSSRPSSISTKRRSLRIFGEHIRDG